MIDKYHVKPIVERIWHAMRMIVPNEWYGCDACGYQGTLAEAIKHAITNQEIVRT